MIIGDKIKLPRMALNLAGIAIDDKTTDLMNRVLEKLEERKALLNIKDVAKIQSQWEKDWKEHDEERLNKEGKE